MENAPLLLLHWEAFHPYADIKISLDQATASKTFLRERLRLALPYDYLRQARASLAESDLSLGANDMFSAAPHSFTESIAVNALHSAKAAFALLGKAALRHAPDYPADDIKHKLNAALQRRIPVFFCFGETAEEAEAGRAGEVIHAQLSAAFEGVAQELLSLVHFVYDTPQALFEREEIQEEQRDQLHDLCRQQYAALWGDDVAPNLKTLCALPAHMPIPKVFLESSPFAGLYFKMVDADLTWLGCEPANTKPAAKAAETTTSAKGDENPAADASDAAAEEAADASTEATDAPKDTPPKKSARKSKKATDDSP